MSIDSKCQLVEQLWIALCKQPFSSEKLIEDIINDCGHDAAGLTSRDVVDLCRGRKSTDLSRIAFAFDEVLAFYLAGDIDDEIFVRAVFVCLILSHVIRQGAGDWSFSFDKFLTLLCGNRYRGGSQFRMEFVKELVNE